MSNSNLIHYKKLSPNMSKPRQGTIQKITIHHTAGVGTIESLGDLFASPSRRASSNYGVGNDGRIGLYVDEANRAWTSDSAENDNVAVTIEVFNSSSKDAAWPVSDDALHATIDLCVDICRRNSISTLNFIGNPLGNLTLHRYFAPTLCPGPYLESRMPYIASTVNVRLTECREQEEEVKAALETLHTQGIIRTPSYWRNNFHAIRYLGELLIKMGQAEKATTPTAKISDISVALLLLFDKGIINTPQYWLHQYKRLPHLEELLINVAKSLS